MNARLYQFKDVPIIVTFLYWCIVPFIVSEFDVNLRHEITMACFLKAMFMNTVIAFDL